MTAAPRKTKPRRKPGRGVLFLLAGLFAVSALVRFGEGIGAVFAAASDTQQPAAQVCTPDEGVALLLDALRDRERRVATREGAVADREQALKIADQRIQARLDSLIAAENELSQLVAFADKASEQDVARLVAVYENMKPKEAAPLFAAMSPEFAAGFLARMRPEAAAAIFANLDPQIATAISIIVAGRNAGAPPN